LNSDPKTNAEGIYMLSRFSFFIPTSEIKIRSMPSQWNDKTSTRASPTLSCPLLRTEAASQLN